jgi:hypothetical protein
MSGETKSTALTLRVNQYEEKQKKKLVELGTGLKPWRDIVKFLKNEIELAAKMSNFHHEILCFRSDGCYQLNRSIEMIYGVSQGKGDDKPSGGGESNLETLDIKLADGTRLKVPYGKIALPEAGEGANIEISYDKAANKLHVTGSCEFQWASMIDEIVEQTRLFLNTESIYKSQAIELNSDFEPNIIDLSNIDDEFMVLSETTKQEMKPFDSRILHPEKCVAMGIPLKLGVLLEGPYGTGKTLFAFKAAKKAIGNNWTFIYLKDPKLLATTLKLSKTLDKSGNGIIVFVEDIDQVTTGDRDKAMQDILNTLDGGDTKGMNVISMFTTNHLEKINPTFLRGKRIGSIISMGPLTANTAMEYIHYTFKDTYHLDEDGMAVVCQKIEEYEIVPAFMAEICEKVKSDMIFEEPDTPIQAIHIEVSLKAYLKQVGLSRTHKADESDNDLLARSLRKVLFDRAQNAESTVFDKVAQEVLE